MLCPMTPRLCVQCTRLLARLDLLDYTGAFRDAVGPSIGSGLMGAKLYVVIELGMVQ